MSNHRDGGNVIHIIGGNEADNQDGGRSGAAISNLTYGGNVAVVSEPPQISMFGPSSFVNDGSYKFRHCKQFYTEAGCPFGDNCIHIHDKNAKVRESLAVVVAPGSGGGYQNVVATGNVGGSAAPLPLATPPLAPLPARPPATLPLARRPLVAKTISTGTVRPLFWRTRLCNRWQQTGYCQFGSNCIFAHGEAELQRYGGGEVNQRAIVQNLPARPARPTPSGPSAGHAVTVPAADAGGSRQMSSATQGPIPSRNAWKVPKKINGIYGDWIDDTMP
ncbi:putative transcription factor C3H family [Helianthus anomalus]